MIYEVVGIEKLNYISKKTGQPVRGTNLHMVYPSTTDRVTGNLVERLYFPERIDTSKVSVGDRLDVYFNRYGSVDSFQTV